MTLYFMTYNALTFHKSMDSNSQFITYCTTIQFILHIILALNMEAKLFYLNSDESATDFLINKKVWGTIKLHNVISVKVI